MSLFIARETSSFLFEAILVLFCVSAIDFGEYWKVDVHWIIGSRICIMVGASISIPAMVTMSMVSMMSQMLVVVQFVVGFSICNVGYFVPSWLHTLPSLQVWFWLHLPKY